jgi:hypothetical protein
MQQHILNVEQVKVVDSLALELKKRTPQDSFSCLLHSFGLLLQISLLFITGG